MLTRALLRRIKKRGRRPVVSDFARRLTITKTVIDHLHLGVAAAFRLAVKRHKISVGTVSRIYYAHRPLFWSPPGFEQFIDRIRGDVELVTSHVPEAFSQDDDVLELIDAGGLTVAWARRLRDCAPSELAHVVALIRADIAGIVLLLKK